MRIEPVQKANIPLQVRIDKVTKVIAVLVAFLSTFIFFVKILFF